MPRQPLITRPRKFTIHIPEDVAVRLELFLHSTALGRVPQGALGKFITERTVEYLDRMKTPKVESAEAAILAAATAKHFGAP